MIRQLVKAWTTLSALAWMSMPVEAQCAGCEWADRGDRWEGVVLREPVSGASFELLSVQHRKAAETIEGERLYLTFWLPEPAELDEIEVWQPGVHYRMQPAHRQYAAGRQHFAWPRDAVIGPLRLSADALYARIRRGEVYYPALLSTRADSTPAAGYSFVFMSGGGIDAVCTIARQDEGGRVVRRFEWFESEGGTVVVEWNGLDDQGRSVPAGLYTLRLEGEMLAETFRPLDRSLRFWHLGHFETEDER